MIRDKTTGALLSQNTKEHQDHNDKKIIIRKLNSLENQISLLSDQINIIKQYLNIEEK